MGKETQRLGNGCPQSNDSKWDISSRQDCFSESVYNLQASATREPRIEQSGGSRMWAIKNKAPCVSEENHGINAIFHFIFPGNTKDPSQKRMYSQCTEQAGSVAEQAVGAPGESQMNNGTLERLRHLYNYGACWGRSSCNESHRENAKHSILGNPLITFFNKRKALSGMYLSFP